MNVKGIIKLLFGWLKPEYVFKLRVGKAKFIDFQQKKTIYKLVFDYFSALVF
jgi:hypothetical protein